MFDKLSSFGLSFILRVVVPGIWGLAIFLVGIFPWISQTEIYKNISSLVVNIGGAVIIVFFIGLLVSLSDDFIYRLYEGRAFWPEKMRDFFVNRLNKKVDKLYRKAEAKKVNQQERAELWSWLRGFPTDSKGKPIATCPTEMGNILAAYEEYPDRKYGMDSVFYWYRIWLSIEEEVRKCVDQIWANADCLIYLSFVSIVGALLFIILLLVKLSFMILSVSNMALISLPIPFSILTIGIVVLLLTFLIFYRLSLPSHKINGEYFKSIFDLFRQDIVKIQLKEEPAEEQKKWDRTWSYLQYGKIAKNSKRGQEVKG